MAARFDVHGNCTEIPNYYEVLGVDVNATQKQIRKSFMEKARLLHPDKNSGRGLTVAEEKMKELNQAYEILYDPQKRIQYDDKLADDDSSIVISKDLM